MAEQKDKLSRSRRALRRARTEFGDEESTGDEAAQPDEDASDGSEPQDEASDDAASGRPRRGETRKTRRKRRALPQTEDDDDEGAGVEQIRDRNRRLRERAAAARRSRRQDQDVASPQGLDARELVDDALARTANATTRWIRRHFNAVQWTLVLGVAGGMGWMIFGWRSERARENASDELLAGVSSENALVPGAGEAAESASSTRRRLEFLSDEARLAAAAEAYQRAAEGASGSATTLLAELGLAGTLYDMGRHDEALAKYELVKDSKLAAHDRDVRGRALEGMGLCFEAKEDLDGALRTFRELENVDEASFVALARYHQARLLWARGEKDRALELVKQALEKMEKLRGEEQRSGYLEQVARELLHTIDPSAAAARASVGGRDPAELRRQMRQVAEQVARERSNLDEAELEELLKDPEKLQKMLLEMGSAPAEPSAVAPEAPAPAEPEPAPPDSP